MPENNHKTRDFSISPDESTKEQPQQTSLSLGEQLVGISFNPSNDDSVAKAKSLCAELMNLLHEEATKREASMLSSILYQHTVGEILNAQMNVVKFITLKY